MFFIFFRVIFFPSFSKQKTRFFTSLFRFSK